LGIEERMEAKTKEEPNFLQKYVRVGYNDVVVDDINRSNDDVENDECTTR